jgi:hypothetical protein
MERQKTLQITEKPQYLIPSAVPAAMVCLLRPPHALEAAAVTPANPIRFLPPPSHPLQELRASRGKNPTLPLLRQRYLDAGQISRTLLPALEPRNAIKTSHAQTILLPLVG